MLDRVRPRFSHATVVAYLALFVALSGSSYAAVQLSRGSVKGKHIAKNAVTSKKVKDGTLLAQDFRSGQLPTGPQGERGPQGAPGAQGEAGAAAATNIVARKGAETSCSGSGCQVEATVSCQPGERATGGGFDEVPAVVPDGEAIHSGPIGTPPTGWKVIMRDSSTGPFEGAIAQAVVLCASP
jgi:hypothetical protein